MRRNPDVNLGSFMRQVETTMLARFGVGFAKLQQDMDPLEGPKLAEAAASGTAPSAFVDAFAEHYPLTAVAAGDDPAAVGRVNRGAMALGTFARESEDWVQGRDGAAYRQDPEGVSRLVSDRAPSGEGFGFRAEHAEGAVLGDDGLPGPGAEFAPLTGGQDIGVAIAALDRSLESRLAVGAGPGR